MDYLLSGEVIAALAGAVCGGFLALSASIIIFILNFLFKRIGKLKIIENRSSIEYSKRDGMGGFVETDNLDGASRIKISIDVDIYNQTEVSKTLGGFQIEVNSRGKNIKFPVEEIHLSKDSTLPYAPMSYSKEVSVVTIPPKESKKIRCYSFPKTKEFPNSFERINILAKLPNGKEFKWGIIEIE